MGLLVLWWIGDGPQLGGLVGMSLVSSLATVLWLVSGGGVARPWGSASPQRGRILFGSFSWRWPSGLLSQTLKNKDNLSCMRVVYSHLLMPSLH